MSLPHIIILLPAVVLLKCKPLLTEETRVDYMLLTSDQLADLQATNYLQDEKYLWPGRHLLFKVSPDFDEELELRIYLAVRNVMNYTCITFEQANYCDLTYVEFFMGTETVAQVGFRDDVQKATIDAKGSDTDVYKALFAALGYMQEVCRKQDDDSCGNDPTYDLKYDNKSVLARPYREEIEVMSDLDMLKLSLIYKCDWTKELCLDDP